MESPEVPPEINVLGRLVDGELYLFMFDNKHQAETRRKFSEFAENTELNFSWHDLQILSAKLDLLFKDLTKYQVNPEISPSVIAMTFSASRLRRLLKPE